jgi:hypothetical protein
MFSILRIPLSPLASVPFSFHFSFLLPFLVMRTSPLFSLPVTLYISASPDPPLSFHFFSAFLPACCLRLGLQPPPPGLHPPTSPGLRPLLPFSWPPLPLPLSRPSVHPSSTLPPLLAPLPCSASVPPYGQPPSFGNSALPLTQRPFPAFQLQCLLRIGISWTWPLFTSDWSYRELPLLYHCPLLDSLVKELVFCLYFLYITVRTVLMIVTTFIDSFGKGHFL